MDLIYKLLCVCLLWVPLCSLAGIPDGLDSDGTPIRSDENGYVEPFKIADNIYYIGDKWVSSYLVVTGKGLAVIDTLDYPFSRWLPINIKKLGFALNDIRYLIITHGHSDHVGGAHYMENIVGVPVLISAQALTLAGQQSTLAKGEKKFLPPQGTRLITDGMSLKLGDTLFIFHHTPGHTLGAYSIEFDALYGKRYHRALVYGGMGTNFSGLSQAKAYLDSVQRMQAIHVNSNPYEVNLASHPHLATLFERRDRALKNGLRAAYVDAGGVNHFLTLLKMRGEEKLRKELQYRSESKELMP